MRSVFNTVRGWQVITPAKGEGNPSKPSYTIYDEDGPSSSLGDLKDIDDGILRQSLWVYLWTKRHKDIWPKLNILLAKFQRK